MAIDEHLHQISTHSKPDLCAISHRVFMQHALPQGSSDLCPTSFVIHFRTMYAETACLVMLESIFWSGLNEVLRVTLTYPGSRSVAGNLFEGAVHKNIHIFPSSQLTRMTSKVESPPARPAKKSMGKSTKNPPKFETFHLSETLVKVDFKRLEVVNFTFEAPNQMNEDTYYRGCRTTALIDGFLLSTSRVAINVYLLQITTSEKKESHSLKRGPHLIAQIVRNIKSSFKRKLPVKLHFVLVGPSEDLRGESDQTWKLPTKEILGFSYEVYYCTLQLPNNS